MRTPLNPFYTLTRPVRNIYGLVFPLALWAMIWLGISSSNTIAISDLGGLWSAFNSLRSLLPFVAGIIAFVLVVVRVLKKRGMGSELASPLGFTFMYGLVGLVAAWVSPDINTAFWWSGLYLMVPLVLWGISGTEEASESINNLLSITWIMVILISLALAAIASYYLDFDSVIRNPSLLAECKSGNWYDLTSGSLRDTGVGRYAAIAGIVALSLIFRKKLWVLGLIIFGLTTALLLFTGARGAMAGFFVAIPLMVVLYLGRKALWGGIPLVIAGMLLLWVTGLHSVFYERCVLSATAGFWPVRVVESAFPEGTNITLIENTMNQLEESLALVATEPNIKTKDEFISVKSNPRSSDAHIGSNSSNTDGNGVNPDSQSTHEMNLITSSNMDESISSAESNRPDGRLVAETAVESVESSPVKGYNDPRDEPVITGDILTAMSLEPVIENASGGTQSEIEPTSLKNADSTVHINDDGKVSDSVLFGGSSKSSKNSDYLETDINSLQTEELQKPQDNPSTVGEKAGLKEIPSTGSSNVGSNQHKSNIGQALYQESVSEKPLENRGELDLKFFEFTGRTAVWKESLQYLKGSPFIGYGFHADRIIFNTHAHNSLIQALIQTGILGTVLFMVGVGMGWVLLIRLIRIRHRLSERQFHNVMIISGVMAFLTVRAFPESTGAFYGIDWLILAPMLMYIHLTHKQYFYSTIFFNTKYVPGFLK